jgi:hypothetical protein
MAGEYTTEEKDKKKETVERFLSRDLFVFIVKVLVKYITGWKNLEELN